VNHSPDCGLSGSEEGVEFVLWGRGMATSCAVEYCFMVMFFNIIIIIIYYNILLL
jgi:hypothetical protein